MPINGFTHSVDPQQAARTATHQLFASSLLVPSQSQASENRQQTILDPEDEALILLSVGHTSEGVQRFVNWSRTRRHQMQYYVGNHYTK